MIGVMVMLDIFADWSQWVPLPHCHTCMRLPDSTLPTCALHSPAHCRAVIGQLWRVYWVIGNMVGWTSLIEISCHTRLSLLVINGHNNVKAHDLFSLMRRCTLIKQITGCGDQRRGKYNKVNNHQSSNCWTPWALKNYLVRNRNSSSSPGWTSKILHSFHELKQHVSLDGLLDYGIQPQVEPMIWKYEVFP